MRVNGINTAIQSMMMLLAPAAAGALYDGLQLRAIFWVDVLTAIIGISLMLALKIERREVPAGAEKTHVFKDMAIGIRYAAGTKWLRQFLGIYVLYSLMFGPVIFLTPLMVARSFGEEPWRLVAHEIVFAVGMTLGGAAAGAFAGKAKNKVILVLMACAAFGAGTLLMGFSPNFWFYLGTMAATGLSVPFVNTGSMTVLQTKIPPDLMGRVFGLVMIVNGMLPLSMAIFGPISDRVRVETLLIITGAAMAAISAAGLLLKDMVRAGREAPVEVQGA